jgi:uncharacterized membrane protein YphA (DoxX/SURF4 family)
MRSITTWVLSIILALAFLGAGAAKLSAQPMMVTEFALFGYPQWFMYLTGLIEVVSAILLLVPRVAGIGAGLLVCVMLGALGSHLTHGQAAMIGAPAVLLILALILGSLRGWSRATFAPQGVRIAPPAA